MRVDRAAVGRLEQRHAVVRPDDDELGVARRLDHVEDEVVVADAVDDDGVEVGELLDVLRPRLVVAGVDLAGQDRAHLDAGVADDVPGPRVVRVQRHADLERRASAPALLGAAAAVNAHAATTRQATRSQTHARHGCLLLQLFERAAARGSAASPRCAGSTTRPAAQRARRSFPVRDVQQRAVGQQLVLLVDHRRRRRLLAGHRIGLLRPGSGTPARRAGVGRHADGSWSNSPSLLAVQRRPARSSTSGANGGMPSAASACDARPARRSLARSRTASAPPPASRGTCAARRSADRGTAPGRAAPCSRLRLAAAVELKVRT